MGSGFRRFSGKADMRRFQTVRAYLFLLPFLVFFILVTAFPVLYGGYLSLFGQHGAKMWFVGLSNFKSAFTDPLFWQGFGMPVFLLLVQVPGMIVIAIFIGLLYERIRHSVVYRLIFYLPYAMPGVVAGIVWSYIFSQSMSPLVPLWNLFGVAKPIFITLSSVRWILLIIILWEWTGYTSLIVYSTLVSIPKELGEAAEMDGATWFKVAYYIKVPLLRNTVFVLFIFNSIGAMQVFNEPRMLNILLNLPQNYTPAMYLYNQAFAYGSFTYSIAMGLVLAAVIFVISFFFMRQSMKELDVHA
jgi:multiple sugar transport system permease protein